MNKVIMSGWIAQNMQFHTTKSGKTKAEFDLIVKRSYKSADGQKIYDYPHVVVWIPQIVKYLQNNVKEGTHIEIEGSWHNEIVPRKDKKTKKKIDYVLLEKLFFLATSKGKQDTAAGADFASMGQEDGGECSPQDFDNIDW